MDTILAEDFPSVLVDVSQGLVHVEIPVSERSSIYPGNAIGW